MRGAYPAARSRFQDIVEKYPNFSGGDNALYYLAQTLERLKTPQLAAPYYARIITDFPLSPHVKTAKTKLAAMRQPIPRPTRAMLARAQADAVRRHHRDLFQKIAGMMSSGPDTSTTLKGPVRLSTPQQGGAEMARGSPGAAPPANVAIVAEPVGEASLSAGKPVDVKSSATSPAENHGSKAQESNPGSNSSSAVTPVKKKGRFHILKKLVKPF